MNTASLRRYAPAARKQFREAVRSRAAKVGLTEGRALPVTVSGDYALLEGSTTPQPRAFADQRRSLEERIRVKGFDGVVEEVAYTWFNRFAAIRYMELHGYLEHGLRMLSHPLGGERLPQALEEATSLDLPGLDRSEVLAMRLDGSRDEELFRMLLLAQCRALHEAMPFLFEPIDDATELLLPDGLLAWDSVRGRMVVDVDETDWEPIEVLGWLYQFYVSEEKARIDKQKSVGGGEIAPKTQLFTPTYIVKYLVQNSLGRLWLDIEPTSTIKEREGWEYWVTPAQQEPEVEEELSRLAAESRAAHPTPESITFLDPCAGSGHILVEAYDVFKAMYAERGYGRREIPRLVLERNLFGLEIDPRAAQLAGFALLMKARADDRTIVKNPPKLNVMAVRSSEGLSVESILASFDSIPDRQALRAAFESIRTLFARADVYGSLICPSAEDMGDVALLREVLAPKDSDLPESEAIVTLRSLLHQAEILARRYDVAVTNPPYLDVTKVGEPLKSWAARTYPIAKADLWAMFIERCRLASTGYFGLVTMHAWMFLSTYESLRERLLKNDTIISVAHLGSRAFREVSGEVVQVAAFILRDRHLSVHRGVYQRLIGGTDVDKELGLRNGTERYDWIQQSQFNQIPGSPLAYWASEGVRELFRIGKPLGRVLDARVGLQTGDNPRFVRFWWEVGGESIGRGCTNREDSQESAKRWFPFNKGGGFRRWYGNLEHIVNWNCDGAELFALRPKAVVRNPDYYFRPSISWSKVGTAGTTFRYYAAGSIFADAGMSAFSSGQDLMLSTLGYVNSPIIARLLPILNPTVNLDIGYFQSLPFVNQTDDWHTETAHYVSEVIQIAKADWDDGENSIDFLAHPVLRHQGSTLLHGLGLWQVEAHARIDRTVALETAINSRFIETANLRGQVDPASGEQSCVWIRPDPSLLARSFLSYGVGVLMGRWAHEAGDVDDDGILPVTQELWFGDDDTAERLAEFVGRAWPREGLRDNLALLASGVGAGEDVPPLDALRRYLAMDFYGDHLRQYRNRPIYWLFFSGKRRAFGALVYLHRYNAGTLSRMRVNYVVPLQQRMAARLEQLGLDIEASATTAERRRRTKERDDLQGQLDELRDFDERLRHVAGQQVELDLDDGVRANYAKFGDLLAESKAIVGDKDE